MNKDEILQKLRGHKADLQKKYPLRSWKGIKEHYRPDIEEDAIYV